MSNPLAVAAVTATLRQILFDAINADLGGAAVTTKPPDKARDANDVNQLNLFLYQPVLDAGLRNDDPPGARPGESAPPALPLQLHYLITAYGANDDDRLAHRVLGTAMGTLHDHPVLGRDEIRTALPGNDLHRQVERIRLSWQPLSIDDMSKLWTAFQTQYRISAYYQACVVLLESNRRGPAALPVLTRGPDDSGVSSRPDLVPPFPTVESAQPVPLVLGGTLTATGHHLTGATAIRLTHGVTGTTFDLSGAAFTEVTDETITATVPDQPAQLPAGIYTMAAVFTAAGVPEATSNVLSTAIAPQVTAGLPATFVAGTAGLDLTVNPPVRDGQSAHLLIGGRQLAGTPGAGPGELRFAVAGVPRGVYPVRIRVDGIDSPVVLPGPPPRFDPSQQVRVT
ncbi:DUF4255 domain-containing protein [Jidongwangia harbinensis]|uniref:DUF4255 domain-containing protein n=1 Tax=Jidongwangia harbinensis TaxID=2878561 RepID=UPI001CD9E350|nr:DUF4255 domain-containing protein [Jidongwangia harbinensis]MCA2218012.1 DUF4255 domain-containing protein [Jidongwangia harbinensis]